MNLLPSMHMMRWAFAAVAVVVSGLFGYQLGSKNERESIAAELLQNETEWAAAEEQYQAQVSQLRTQRDVADASNKSLQKTVKRLQARSLERESALRLYDNIEGKDRNSGLGVDTVSLVKAENGQPKELHVTVVQARGRDRVKGQIGLALVGEKAGAEWREVIADVAGDSALGFDMRFYQTVVVPLPADENLIDENHIDIVEIDVKPTDKRHKSVSYAMDWSGILQD